MIREFRSRAAVGARRAAWAILVAIGAALLAVGCGNDSGDGDKASSGASSTRPKSAGPATITPPPTDAQLKKDMGVQGTALTQAGCIYGAFDEERAEHVDEAKDLQADSFPPSSGTHFSDWAPYGRYDKPIEDGYAVHDLEHGGVVVWLGTEVTDDTAKAVDGLLDDEEKWVVAPRRDIPGLYSAAWAKGLSCPPAALAKLGPDALATALDTWYETVESTGSKAEKDVPAYAGSMKEPTPERDISADPPS